MKFQNVCLESLTCVLPPDAWSSDAIEERLRPVYDRLHLPFGRLELMTGIRERRFWATPMLASEASAQAGRKALRASACHTRDIDLLAHCAVCRDRLEPATAAYVHGLLELASHTQIFDISNACLGWVNALALAGGLIDSGKIRRGLIVAGENGRPLVERTISELLDPKHTRNTIKPFFANLTIGAGAAAGIVSHCSVASDGAPRLLAAVVETDTRHNNLCEGHSASGDALEMQTDSEELLNAGISVAERAWAEFKKESGWDEDTPDCIITHQVGRAHRRRLFAALNLDPERDFSTFEFLGNVGSVSLPATCALAVEEGVIKPGDRVALLGIGSGLSCMMLAMQW